MATHNATPINQDVVVSVSAINELSVSASAVTLVVGGSTAGASDADATDASTSFAITTNASGQKITAALSAPYAAGLSLDLELAAPAGATATRRTLGTAAQDVLTGITRVAASGLTMTYTATALASTAATAGTGGETRTVTLTLTDS